MLFATNKDHLGMSPDAASIRFPNLDAWRYYIIMSSHLRCLSERHLNDGDDDDDDDDANVSPFGAEQISNRGPAA